MKNLRAVLAVLLLVLASCGGDAVSDSTTTSEAVTTTMESTTTTEATTTTAEATTTTASGPACLSDTTIDMEDCFDRAELDLFVEVIYNDLNVFYGDIFADTEWVEPYWVFIYDDQQWETPCGEISYSDVGPYYCPEDETMVFGVEMMWGIYASENFGDFAAALVVAHEYAHHVQHQLGIFEEGHETLATELQADCLAGAWGDSLRDAGRLADDDAFEISTLSVLIGDLPEQGRTHGTPGERLDAFLLGLDGEDGADGCLVFTDGGDNGTTNGEDPLAEITQGGLPLAYDGTTETGVDFIIGVGGSMTEYHGASQDVTMVFTGGVSSYGGCGGGWDEGSIGYCAEPWEDYGHTIVVGQALFDDLYNQGPLGQLAAVLATGYEVGTYIAFTGADVTYGEARDQADCLVGSWLGGFEGSTSESVILDAYQLINDEFDGEPFGPAQARLENFTVGFLNDSC